MALALRACVEGLEMADIEAAIAGARSLVRCWSMRGTLHLSAAEDIRWLLDLLGPVFMAGGKPRRLQLGLDDETVRRGVEAMGEILAPGEVVTRDAIVERLNARGFALDRKTQAPIHLIAQAALAGVIVLGPEAPGAKSTYTLAEGWLPPTKPLSRAEALSRLARRYLTGYGPADLADFAAWSGLAMGEARQGWDAALAEGAWTVVNAAGRSLWLDTGALPAQPGPISVRLLPAFDAYVLGYKNRAELVAPERQSEVYHGGQTVPVVMIDGLAAGTWHYGRGPKKLTVDVTLFEPVEPSVERLIRQEADDIGRLLGLPATVDLS